MRIRISHPLDNASRIHLYEAQLRTAGSAELSTEAAELFIDSQALRAVPDPDRPGLVRVERPSTPRPEP